MTTSTEDFRPGDVVIIHAPAVYWRWNGKRGTVDHTNTRFVFVYVNQEGFGGWLPEHLIKVDTQAEAEAVLGSDYFD